MSNLRSFKRKLNPTKVWLAVQVAEEKIKIARQVVIEQAKKDAKFAAQILETGGNKLIKEVREACEESVAHARAADDGNPLVGGDTSHELTETIQLDGGEVIMVRPEEVPGHPTDGEKIVMMEGPKLEKSSDEPDDGWVPPPPGAFIDEESLAPLPPETQALVDKHLKKV